MHVSGTNSGRGPRGRIACLQKEASFTKPMSNKIKPCSSRAKGVSSSNNETVDSNTDTATNNSIVANYPHLQQE